MKFNSYTKSDYVKLVMLISAIFLVFPVSGYGIQVIDIGSGSTAGVYYPFAVGIADVLNKNLKNVKVIAHSTGGSAYNNERMHEKKLEMSMMQNDVAFYAYEDLENIVLNKDLRAIGTLYREDIHIVVREDSGIKSIEDMKGKKIAIGNPGSGQLRNSTQILETVGIFYEVTRDESKFLEAVAKLKRGEIDGLFYTVGWPASGLIKLTEEVDCRFISLDNSTIKRMVSDFPFYVRSFIPRGTYKNLDTNIDTIAVKASLVVRKDIPASLVCAMTKVIFENLDYLRKKSRHKHKQWENVSLMRSRLGVGIPFHLGAEEYFREQVIEVREKPYSMAPVIGYVNRGMELNIYTDKWNMYKIQTITGEKGWIRKDQVTNVAEYRFPGSKVKVNALNFRRDPSLDKDNIPLRILRKGEILEKIGQQYNKSEKILWFYVRLENGEKGWVSSNSRYVEKYHHTGYKGVIESLGKERSRLHEEAKKRWLK